MMDLEEKCHDYEISRSRINRHLLNSFFIYSFKALGAEHCFTAVSVFIFRLALGTGVYMGK